MTEGKNFKYGDQVYFKQNSNEKWVKGQIDQKVKDRSYIVNSDQGKYRCNTIHIMNPNPITYDSSLQETRKDVLTTNRTQEEPAQSIVPDTITHHQDEERPSYKSRRYSQPS